MFLHEKYSKVLSVQALCLTQTYGRLIFLSHTLINIFRLFSLTFSPQERLQPRVPPAPGRAPHGGSQAARGGVLTQLRARPAEGAASGGDGRAGLPGGGAGQPGDFIEKADRVANDTFGIKLRSNSSKKIDGSNSDIICSNNSTAAAAAAAEGATVTAAEAEASSTTAHSSVNTNPWLLLL